MIAQSKHAFATLDGDIVTWKGLGVGRFQAGGVFEFEVDANGTTSSKIWEWK